MKKIKVAIFGVGNCASSLIQGIYYYMDKNPDDVTSLMHWDIGDYKPTDIEIVAAFDVDKRKVGKDVSEAIFSKPNCTKVFQKSIPKMGVKVMMGRVLDSIAPHMKEYPEDHTFLVSDDREANIVDVLRHSRAEIALNYIPVGSEAAARYYAKSQMLPL